MIGPRRTKKGIGMVDYNWPLYILMITVLGIGAVIYTVGKAIYDKVTRQDPPAE